MRLLAACVGSCCLAACGGARDTDTRTITREVEAQLAVARDATTPAGVTLLSSSGPKREPHSVSAEWSFEAPADWQRYREQAEASLRRAGYQRAAMADAGLAYVRRAPGDIYRVQIAGDASSARVPVTVTFLAAPH